MKKKKDFDINEPDMKDETIIDDESTIGSVIIETDEKETDETVNLYEMVIDFTSILSRIVIAAALVFCAISLAGINDSVSKISETGIVQSAGSGNGQEQNQQQTSTLFELDYAKEHDIMPANAKETFSLQDKEYFVFFYQTGCGYCIDTEPYIEEYIKAGKTEQADIFMVNLAMLESDEQAALFWDLDGSYTFEENPTADTFRVTGTPTMLHIKDGKAQAGIGPDEIVSMLAQIK